MDDTLLFAYCITDGELDNMTEIQKSIILHVVKNITKEHNPEVLDASCERKQEENDFESHKKGGILPPLFAYKHSLNLSQRHYRSTRNSIYISQT